MSESHANLLSVWASYREMMGGSSCEKGFLPGAVGYSWGSKPTTQSTKQKLEDLI